MKKCLVNGISLSVFFDTRRQKADSTYPVKFRVTYKRERAYFLSGVDLTENQWMELPSASNRQLADLRETIVSGFERIKDQVKNLSDGDGFSLERLRESLKRENNGSLSRAFNKKISALNVAGQTATASTYQCAIKSIRKFAGEEVMFLDITPDWLNRYETHLLNEGKSITTVKFYTECIRSVINEAKDNGIISGSQYPFGKGKFKIKKGVGRKPALTISQISEIMRIQLSTDTEQRSRDLWLFSYMTNGIRFSDMLRLKYRDITYGEIHFYRETTGRAMRKQKEISASLLPEMREIIGKWGNTDRNPDNYIFPFLKANMDMATEKRIIQNVIRLTNKKMAEISKMLNISTISTLTARHSYAEVLKRSGVGISYISESLGHADLKTTENYLASLEQEERAKNSLQLITFKSWYV